MHIFKIMIFLVKPVGKTLRGLNLQTKFLRPFEAVFGLHGNKVVGLFPKNTYSLRNYSEVTQRSFYFYIVS